MRRCSRSVTTAGLRVSELTAASAEHLEPQPDGSGAARHPALEDGSGGPRQLGLAISRNDAARAGLARAERD